MNKAMPARAHFIAIQLPWLLRFSAVESLLKVYGSARCSGQIRGLEAAGKPQRSSFLGDEFEMVRDVFDFNSEVLFQSDQATLVMHAVAGPAAGRQRAQNASQLSPRLLKNGQFLFQIAFLITQGSSETALVIADQQRTVLGNNPFHAVYPGLIRVDQMANDF